MSFEFKSIFAKNILINRQHELLFTDKQSQQIDDEIIKIKEEYNQLCKETNEITLNSPMMIAVSEPVVDNEVKSLRKQLKQVECSRQMYRVCLEKVLSFLEQAHHNLESLCDKLNGKCKRSTMYDFYPIPPSVSNLSNYNTFRDFTIRKPSHIQFSPDEVPPDKLSKEALSLIRIIRSTLNTTEYVKNSDQYFKQSEFLQAIKQEFCQENSPKSSNNECDTKFKNISNVQTQKFINRSKPDSNASYVDNESGFSSLNSSHEKHVVPKEILLSKITISGNSQQNYDNEYFF